MEGIPATELMISAVNSECGQHEASGESGGRSVRDERAVPDCWIGGVQAVSDRFAAERSVGRNHDFLHIG